MKLESLTNYKNTVIQCHDIPDADTIGSGFALLSWFRSNGKKASLVYGGREEISKPNLCKLIKALEIEIAYVHELPKDTDLLITVDCQRGAGNTETFELPENADFFVIDHHRAEIPEGENTIIRPYLASCATLVWNLLREEGYDIEGSYKLVNALYYGLFTDTNGLSELRHPLDRDLADISYDPALIRDLKNSAITLDELFIIGDTLNKHEIIKNIGLFHAEPCDPNLLGFTSDIAQQVASLECCVVYCEQKNGLKLSIRSSSREIMANEIAEFLCRDVGSGGGSIEKAGGFLGYKGINQVAGEQTPEEYLKSRFHKYIGHYTYIYAGDNEIDFASFPLYRKKKEPVGFVRTTDLFPDKAKIRIRTLEGDVDIDTGESLYLMIGIEGEVYPISRERFSASYEETEVPYEKKAEYEPSVLNRVTGEHHLLRTYAKTCIPKDEKLVRATQLEKDAKVFTQWDMEKYYTGRVGDYLVSDEGNFDDCYIVRQNIFLKTYSSL